MVAAGLSIALMIVVLLKYGLRDDVAPTTPTATQPHAGAKHHSAETTHVGVQVAPLQPFATAKVGDWIGYRVVNRSTALPQDIEAFVIARVTKATETSVTVEYRGHAPAVPDKRETWEREYPRHGLTIDQLTGNDVSKWTISELVITDVTREVGGRTFRAKQLTYAAKDPLFPAKRVRNELWISEEVPLEGLVEDRNVQDLDTMHSEQTKQLIGFGTADAITWGKQPDVP